MTQDERTLFFELCAYKQVNPQKIESLLKHNASPALLGHLFFNRMQGIAYSTLEKLNLLENTNREFQNSLKKAHHLNTMQNESFAASIRIVETALKDSPHPFALLKGALLFNEYPVGCRTSNDIDLLVESKNVTQIGKLLNRAGFQQGRLKNGTFIPATRTEIITAKMTRGETVPYFLRTDFDEMPYIELDINFSLDYKPDDSNTVTQMLSRSQKYSLGDFSIHTLDKIDFFIHLCGHLYKEATTYPWVEMHRDMTLYKYCDIYTLAQDFTEDDIECIFDRAESLGMTDPCACALLWTDYLLPIHNDCVINYAKNKLKQPALLDTVIWPSEKRKYIYNTEDLKERFFTNNRTPLLKEIPYDET